MPDRGFFGKNEKLYARAEKIDYATFRIIIKSGGSLFWLLAYPSFTGMETLQNGEA